MEEIISKIKIPDGLGHLKPAAERLNGPSSNALDDLFLKPLGFQREDAWLCDLVPHSCVNPKQEKAIKRSYYPFAKTGKVKHANMPRVPKQLADMKRRQEILEEIKESKAKKIILLGDEPIKWFLAAHDDRWLKLKDFGMDADSYGREQEAQIAGESYTVLPLVHPRQAAKLGQHSKIWAKLHEGWVLRVGR